MGNRLAAFVHRRRGCLRSLHMPLAWAECYGLMQKGAAVSDGLRRLQNTSSTQTAATSFRFEWGGPAP